MSMVRSKMQSLWKWLTRKKDCKGDHKKWPNIYKVGDDMLRYRTLEEIYMGMNRKWNFAVNSEGVINLRATMKVDFPDTLNTKKKSEYADALLKFLSHSEAIREGIKIELGNIEYDAQEEVNEIMRHEDFDMEGLRSWVNEQRANPEKFKILMSPIEYKKFVFCYETATYKAQHEDNLTFKGYRVKANNYPNPPKWMMVSKDVDDV